MFRTALENAIDGLMENGRCTWSIQKCTIRRDCANRFAHENHEYRMHSRSSAGRTLVPILVETDAGIIGVGEAGLQRRWQAIAGAIEHLKKWIIGAGPDAHRVSLAAHVSRRVLSRGSADRLRRSAASISRCGTSRARH